jgi:class 3 adenylate cyclase
MAAIGLARGTGDGALRALYRRLGPRYPAVGFSLATDVFYPVFVAGVALLAVWVPMTGGEFFRLALAAVLVQAVYNVLYVRFVMRLVRPVRAWLEGRRDPESSLTAWRAAASLPSDYVLRFGRFGATFLVGLAVWCAYAVWELDLDTVDFLAVFAAGTILLATATGLGFLLTERVVRPVLEDVARCLPEGVELAAPSLPLRWRLFATIPVINLGGGLLVAGLSSIGEARFDDLWLDVAVATGAACTGSLWLTALLARSILEPVERLREATESLGGGDLAARVPVSSTDELGRLGESFNRMAGGLRERERLHEAFGTFVDPDLAERVLEEGTDLGGEEVEVSLLMLDVRGFTAMAERADAASVVARLNELYEQVVPVVVRHGGHANKFVGDGMLAVFGAPERLPDHADRAVAAALEIADCVDRRFGESLKVGVGVNSGEVLVGTVGGGGRLDFTVIGDPVNTAARVEAATRETGDDVLVAEATVRRLRGSFELERRPAMPLKGKSEPVELYAPRRVAARGVERRLLSRGTQADQQAQAP